MATPVLSEATFRQLRDFIYDRCGIFIPDTKKYLLENRLLRRIQERNLNGYDDYLYLVRYSSNGDEMARLFEAVTTNETYFFREQQQLDVLVDSVAPKTLEAKGTKDLRLWSAACSTGEEPYTLVMMIKERMPQVRVDILSSDISDGVLESARKGVYSSYSVRNVPEPYMRKYFSCANQQFMLAPTVKSAVRLENINLVDDKKVRGVRSVDIILCRNVLIYFDEKVKQKVVSLLYDSLRPGGYLFIGSSESLHNVTRAFKPVIINKVIVYQKVQT